MVLSVRGCGNQSVSGTIRYDFSPYLSSYQPERDGKMSIDFCPVYVVPPVLPLLPAVPRLEKLLLMGSAMGTGSRHGTAC
jgi:hypothetical protein